MFIYKILTASSSSYIDLLLIYHIPHSEHHVYSLQMWESMNPEESAQAKGLNRSSAILHEVRTIAK